MGFSANCIYCLDPSVYQAFWATGGAVVSVSRCGITVNSTSALAFVVSTNSSVTAASIDVTGGYSGSTMTPQPTTGVPPVADPLADRPPPTFSATCGYTNLRINSGTVSLYPGVYCGGIKISGQSTSVVFNPGTYILLGGGLSASVWQAPPRSRSRNDRPRLFVAMPTHLLTPIGRPRGNSRGARR